MCTSVDYFTHSYLTTTGQSLSDEQSCYSGHTSRRSSRTNSQSSSISTSTLPLSQSLLSLVEQNNNNTFIKRIKNLFSTKSKVNKLIHLEDEKISDCDSNISQSTTNNTDVVPSNDHNNISVTTNDDVNDTIMLKKKRRSDNNSLTILNNEQENDFYDYESLLKRALNQLEIDRPEFLLRQRQRIVLPCAQLLIGQSRTIVSNWTSYQKLCKLINRDIKYFQQYLEELYECQTSLNKNQQLILNTRTNTQQMNKALNKFLNEYVMCKTCRSVNTNLLKKNRLWMVECQLCGSQTTVKKLQWKKM